MKRLSLIVDKQRAIKCFLGELAEDKIEEDETEDDLPVVANTERTIQHENHEKLIDIENKNTPRSNANELELRGANTDKRSHTDSDHTEIQVNRTDMLITSELNINNSTNTSLNNMLGSTMTNKHANFALNINKGEYLGKKFELHGYQENNDNEDELKQGDEYKERDNDFVQRSKSREFENFVEKDSLEPSAVILNKNKINAANVDERKYSISSLNQSFENNLNIKQNQNINVSFD